MKLLFIFINQSCYWFISFKENRFITMTAEGLIIVSYSAVFGSSYEKTNSSSTFFSPQENLSLCCWATSDFYFQSQYKKKKLTPCTPSKFVIVFMLFAIFIKFWSRQINFDLQKLMSEGYRNTIIAFKIQFFERLRNENYSLSHPSHTHTPPFSYLKM